jgi:neurotransmitter:Na+ symporter, NSS family
LGHAFFTLSLGMGAIMIYGSYMTDDASITKTSFTVAIADTLVALMAGMAIFPIVFANGLEPGAGPGLIFKTLPLAFGQMPGGVFFGMLFFILVVFAAWSSSISLIEPLVAWLVENHGISRVNASVFSGGFAWLLGIATIFSFTKTYHLELFGKTFFDLLDFLTANIMLPLGGLFIALFAAWIMSRQASMEEIGLNGKAQFGYYLWLYLTRIVTPIAVVVVFLNAIGVL